MLAQYGVTVSQSLKDQGKSRTLHLQAMQVIARVAIP